MTQITNHMIKLKRYRKQYREATLYICITNKSSRAR